MKSPGQEHAVALLKKTLEGIETGELAVESFTFRDVDTWSIKVVCGAGDVALERASRGERVAAAAREIDTPSRSLDNVYRDPGDRDACPGCFAVGQMRAAGGLAWLCLACNREAMPFGAKRSLGG